MNANRRQLLWGAGALLAAFSASAGTGKDQRVSGQRMHATTTQADADDVRQLVQANTAFALDLFDTIRIQRPEDNLFLSPFSISSALAMTWAGAQGNTEQEMTDVLRFERNQDDVHPAFEVLLQELDERSESWEAEAERGGSETEAVDAWELSLANALWGREGYDFRERFLATIEEHYDASLQELDFEGATEESRQLINAWVEEQTGGNIPEVLPEESIDSTTVFLLANAIYFNVGWQYPFDEDNTDDEEFTALDGSTEFVPTMSQFELLDYAEVDGHQVVELPYLGHELGMVVILPEAGEFEAFEQNLDEDILARLFDSLAPMEGEIRLPRFGIESSLQLEDYLTELGMESAFDQETAEFGGLTPSDDFWIDDIIHSTFLAVDEEGTEAAAVTIIEDIDEAEPDEEEPDYFEMIVDRPFLFAIRDLPTDSLLFLGRVVDIPDDPGEV